MNIGMLWKDDEPRRTLTQKIARAADYYWRKYGERPTVCFIHPSMLPDGVDEAAGLKVLTARTVQVDHFWLGVSHVVRPADVGPEPARIEEAVKA